MGYDLACVGGLLVGFREWRVVRFGDGNNLQWPGLVLEIAFAPRYSPAVLDENDDKIATKCLFQLLDEFSIEAHSRSGLTHIYTRYQKWLESQDWYDAKAFAND